MKKNTSQSYDIFIKNQHSDFFAKLLIYFNQNIISFWQKNFNPANTAKVLEIGPGKGYFYAALNSFSDMVDTKYFAMDRNLSILENLPTNNVIQSSLPEIKTAEKFDFIHCAYVIEHLANYNEVYQTMVEIKSHLENDGVAILSVPNAMEQKFEFWNIDYSHTYPTTKRNMMMSLLDAGFSAEKISIYEINGLLTPKYFDNYLFYLLLKSIMFFYSYSFFQFFQKIFCRQKSYQLNNFFYKVYCLCKEPNLIIVIQN